MNDSYNDKTSFYDASTGAVTSSTIMHSDMEEAKNQPQTVDDTEKSLAKTQSEIAVLKNYREQLQPYQTEALKFDQDSSAMQGESGMSHSHTLTKTDNSGIKYIDPNNPMHPSGFINKLIIALFAGFGLGVITTAIYIFNGLSHINVSL